MSLRYDFFPSSWPGRGQGMVEMVFQYPVRQRGSYLAILISFDIDGTLEVGDPPGILTMEMVRSAQQKGFFDWQLF